MARARNIKPSFFHNETLVELPFEHRLLFVGLWTLADREGRLEDRPKKIKMEIFPADNVDVESGLSQLEEKGFIHRYITGGLRIIQVIAFLKHQSPHHTEKQSALPPHNGEITVNSRKQDGGNPPDSLIPDSLNHESPFTDSPNPESADALDARVGFVELWEKFPSSYGEKGSRKNAEAAYLKLKPDKPLLERILAALDSQVIDKATKHAAGQFYSNFPHVERWIKNRRWEDEISKSSAQQSRPNKSEQSASAFDEHRRRILAEAGDSGCDANAGVDAVVVIPAGHH